MFLHVLLHILSATRFNTGETGACWQEILKHEILGGIEKIQRRWSDLWHRGQSEKDVVKGSFD
ncbi:MAG: hypothetical protein AB2L14_03475 [Candidatus Xenobiia bacterium LiM19]